MTEAARSWSILSPLLIVAGALLLIALERRWPYEPRQRFLRPGLWDDLIGYALIQSYLLGLVIAAIISWLDAQTGLTRLGLVTDWPVPAQVAFFLLTHDLYIYLFHRAQHRFPALWRIHEAHHSTADVDWLSGSRSHALEILINQTIEFAPIVLLGAAPEVALIKVTLDAVWGMYIHSNVDVRTGRLQWILNGPEMHRWHHAREIHNVNFATKFAWWDWLLGTAHLPAGRKPMSYGLDDPFPARFWSQQLYAFRRASRQATYAGSTSSAATTQLTSPSTATAPRERTA